MESEYSKRTNVFDRLDNTIGNWMEEKATDADIRRIALEVNKYLLENPHPHDLPSRKRRFLIVYTANKKSGEVSSGNLAISISHGGYPSYDTCYSMVNDDRTNPVTSLTICNIIELSDSDMNNWLGVK